MIKRTVLKVLDFVRFVRRKYGYKLVMFNTKRTPALQNFSMELSVGNLIERGIKMDQYKVRGVYTGIYLGLALRKFHCTQVIISVLDGESLIDLHLSLVRLQFDFILGYRNFLIE